MKYVVDAHALIWFLGANSRLGRDAGLIMNDSSSILVLPAIVLAEACWIVEHRVVGLSVAKLMAAVDGDARYIHWPLTRDVIEISNGLSSMNECMIAKGLQQHLQFRAGAMTCRC